MSKGKSLTFYGLFDIVDTIEIPILQRDYAQGRSEEGEVRALFLNSLFDALNADDSEPRQALDLDFVYGSFGEGELKSFSVLDGQQRLTTLFLLHWYLAVENERVCDFRDRFVRDDRESRFTYRTRPSTTEFFNALTSENLAISNESISSKIRNSQWFYLSWEQDPTVQACLTMLDAIQQRFSNSTDGLYERLTNTDKPYITFQFLDLDAFGLSDELYIKMNARGKPLTAFENFKAKLEQQIKSFDSPWPSYYLPFRDGDIGGYEYFIHKIDTDWADIFWPYRNEFSQDNTFDDELMNFIRLIIAYQYLLDSKDLTSQLTNAKNEIFGHQGTLRAVNLSKYDELGCISKSFIIRLITTLDLIRSKGVKTDGISPYLSDESYYVEETTFKRILRNTASYEDKLRFYAFYTYLAKRSNSEHLSEWLRVIYNLTENTIFNTTEEFYNAFFAVDELCQQETPILETLINNTEISGFTGAQILEEKIKAHLILKSGDWREAVVNAERHSFLNGQIGCILNFSGILAHYRAHQNCKWEVECDRHFLDQFKHYSDALIAIFNLIEDSSSSIDYLWERAVLSKGEYFTEKRGDKFNMLSSRDTRNNIPRDHSWRRLLRIGTATIEQKQSYVKAVIDDSLFSTSDVKKSLAKICEKALQEKSVEPWKKALINHTELIAYCRQGFIEKNALEFILLNESQRNHYHSELYTKALELELKNEKSELVPFSQVGYEYVKSREETPHIFLSGMILDKERYSLEVSKSPSGFILRFMGGKVENYPAELKEALEKEGFVLGSTLLPNYLIQLASQNKDLNTVKDKVMSLCAGLRELIT